MRETISSYLSGCEKNWSIVSDKYIPEEEGYLESIMTLSNGYIGVRSSLELSSAGSLPGVFFAGIYDKPDKTGDNDLYGLNLKNKAITPSYAVAPLFHMVELIIGGKSVDFCNCDVKCFRRTLDMKRGLLFGEYELQDKDGKVTAIKTMRAVSKADCHSSHFKIEITAVNYGGTATVRFVNHLDINPQYIKRIKDYTSKTDLIACGETDGFTYLDARISETGMDLSLVSQTIASNGAAKTVETGRTSVREVFVQELGQNETLSFSKLTAFFTGRDCDNPRTCAIDDMKRLSAAAPECLDKHVRAWHDVWQVSDVELTGHSECQLGVRWNIFSLLQLGIETDDDVSISATGLHGQGYFGHVFWDTEIFMLPFYLAVNPQIAKNLLMYRYNRLDAARKSAAEKGFSGAKFPWTSTSEGWDVTPPDWERCANRQIHISGDIAYAFKNYLDWTGDAEFFKRYGIEVIVETAKYYASRATKESDGKYHILDVIGPDEYNIHANDNYYTNHLIHWNIKEALSQMESISRDDAKLFGVLCDKTGWSGDVETHLRNVAENLAFPHTRDGVNEQYVGFFELPDMGKIERDEYGMPLDRSYHYDAGTQVLKQADVVMMHYLFSGDFSPEVKKNSFEYYEQRCNHGSSLSPSIHCVEGIRTGFPENSFGYFVLTALLDLKNLHLDKNLDEGVHMACAGGTWACAVYGFGGVSVENGKLYIAPALPPQLQGLKFTFHFQGRLFKVKLAEENVEVTLKSGEALEVLIYGKSTLFESGAEQSFKMR